MLYTPNEICLNYVKISRLGSCLNCSGPKNGIV